ncbi:endonuclease/exonuclease/phosphatase family protein [uncultured Alistipes sp.]|uniref:endonuclease/exonuclease/phosphatase family protein n=1 Tax=uncultured Alistipes sp. TaxID=538949 RepID=UPI0025CE38FE|nr:endonuclease/exonuclease/phosphatase family protein [uncultured Alistipes sp.]
MKLSFFRFAAVLLFAATLIAGCDRGSDKMRLLYWNIQNGMWSGQGDNYDNFVEWVKRYDPDVCVWCEAQSIYKTGTADNMEPGDRYLTENWGELAARYGHKYWYKGGHRDNFPQVVTSKYPIEGIRELVGEAPDSVVTHGAGWAQVMCGRRKINIVTLHLWPQGYAFEAADREASRVERGGDRYRRMEIERICSRTIATVPDAAGQLWMMMGDFNAVARCDNFFYEYPEEDTRFLVHDYIAGNTSYIDVIAEKYPGEFRTTMHHRTDRRIDFVYCTRPLYDRIAHAEVIVDAYTEPVRDAQELRNFWHPSDHRPILVDFDMN